MFLFVGVGVERGEGGREGVKEKGGLCLCVCLFVFVLSSCCIVLTQ